MNANFLVLIGSLIAGAALVFRAKPTSSATRPPAPVAPAPAPLFTWPWDASDRAQVPDAEPVLPPATEPAPVTHWSPPDAAGPYLAAIRNAETSHDIPPGMLGSLLEQESAFRSNIIFGGPNPQGAIGIAQIVPRWHPDVDPTKPFDAIPYAASYLRANYNRFGQWDLALAAYNWGPTALANKGWDARPDETRKYVVAVLGRLV